MSNHELRDRAPFPSSPRFRQLLALAVSLAVTGAAVAVLSHGTSARPIAAVGRLDTGPAPMLLPAVVVKPEPSIAVLATITVRADRVWPSAEPAGDVPRGDAAAAHGVAMAAASSGGGVDMPYYSFGRSLHRASKE